MRIKNKVVIVTGAGSGIGKETAFLFSKEGAKIVVVDVNEKAGKETSDEINEKGESLFARIDVCNREQTKELVKTVLERFGRIDILINNAGVAQDALITKMTEDQWNKVIDINLKGTFNCIQAVIDVMIEQKQGVIINASSIVGLFGNIGQANYAAAKAGIIGMTKALAKEVGRKGVRVNAVAPGFTITPMISNVPQKILCGIIDKTPLGRLAQTKDIAYAYLFLASDEASFINGAVLCVDGGLTL